MKSIENSPPRVLETIERAWAANPDQRLGQLLGNATYNRDIFQIRDHEWSDVLQPWVRVRGIESNQALREAQGIFRLENEEMATILSVSEAALEDWDRGGIPINYEQDAAFVIAATTRYVYRFAVMRIYEQVRKPLGRLNDRNLVEYSMAEGPKKMYRTVVRIVDDYYEDPWT